ncbi:MAG: D-alanine--D-alanine ligase [Bacteroidetes bacterium HGW-Bacteroidetes-21]|nr:MAG: D-alanine--D-alanine ligase [Bacteroidetes bacterium HGW-Bacteroidetes-21]
MRIGLTYDLRDDYLAQGYSHEETAEFDKEETIAGLESAIKSLGYQVERIGHIKSLAKALVEGRSWDIVFNIAEGVKGIAREAQVPCLLDAWNIPYVFSDGLVLALTLHKAHTKRIIQYAGIPTAPFYEIKNIEDVHAVDLPYPLFLKPVAEGTGKGIDNRSKVENKSELIKFAAYLLDRFKQPVLVETFLPGREFTVGITGNDESCEAIGLMEIHFEKTSSLYGIDAKENYEKCITYSVPEKDIAEACKKVAIDSWKALGCVDGGRVDIRMDQQGVPNFIEVNPLAGLNPVHSDLPILCRLNGISYETLIGRILTASLQRNKLI